MKEATLKKIAKGFGYAALIAAPVAFGATDTIFSAINLKLGTILTGTGGVMITTLSMLVAAVAFLGHNYKTAMGTLGVAILTSVGPTVAGSFFTAVL